MQTPRKGDYASVPISPEGRKVADTWTPEQDGSCLAYGAAALLRMPGRLHITWQDDRTLKIETDAGQQTRLLRFGAPQHDERSARRCRDHSMRSGLATIDRAAAVRELAEGDHVPTCARRGCVATACRTARTPR